MNSFSAENQYIAIVISEFNEKVIVQLLNGAVDSFFNHGGKKENLKIFRVPGAFEIPGTVAQVMKHECPSAVVALGAVIRGGTPHFDFIAGESARGLAEISRSADIPVINGILTTNSLEQALERAGTKAGNKGWDAMESALQTINIYREIQSAN